MKQTICGCEQQRPIQVTITMKRDELIYDISQIAYVEGDIISEDGQHSKHQVMDITEDGNVDRVNRTLNLAWQECVDFLYPYSKRVLDNDSSFNNAAIAPEQYGMALTMPKLISATTLEYLTGLIHEYMICRVLVDWLSITNITNSNSVSAWEAKMEQAKYKIHTIISTRRGAVRRKLHPF